MKSPSNIAFTPILSYCHDSCISNVYCLFDKLGFSVFVATWNVGGRSPPSNMNLDDWLHASPAADIYVLGYVFVFCYIF